MHPTSAPSPLADPARLEALRRLHLLEPEEVGAFQRLTGLASTILDAPVALVSVLDAEHQLLLASTGLPDPWTTGREMPLTHSLCKYVIADAAPLVVSDSREDPRLRGSPAIAQLGVIAYAGVPLLTDEGHAVASFCAIDREPREWTGRELSILRDLSASVLTEIELRADLRERGRMAAALEKERVFLNAVLESLDQGVVACDGSGTLTLFNRATRELHGLPAEPLPAAEWTSRYALFRADGATPLPTAEIPLFRAYAGERVSGDEIVVAPHGRAPRTVLATGQPLHDAAGRPLGAVVVMRDVTERRQAERALRESEERYRRLSEASSEGIAIHEGGRIVDANLAFARLVGAEPGAVAGRDVLDFAAPESRGAIAARIRDGDESTYEAHGLRLDGTVFPAELIPRNIPLDGRVARAVCIRDLTERRRSTAALLRSEERYRRLVEAANDIIYNTDVRGYFTYANPVASRVMGVPAQGLVGMHYTELVREDVREAVRSHYLEQLRTRTPGSYHEFPVRTLDGRELWVGQQLQLIFEGDDVVGTQAVARDVTEQRNLLRMKDEFVSVVSHELRTPLTAVRGALGLLAGGLAGPGDSRGRRLIEIASQNSERLVRLVNDILDIQRMNSGQVTLACRRVSVGRVQEEAAASIQTLAEKAGVDLRLAPATQEVDADPDRLIQALTNLLDNAIKFSPAGGVVWLSAESTAEGVRIDVRDQGRGIPAARLEDVFEPFRQVDSSDARAKGGSGLGLAIVRAIAEQHGGRVEAASEPGRGSTFSLHLPALDGG